MDIMEDWVDANMLLFIREIFDKKTEKVDRTELSSVYGLSVAIVSILPSWCCELRQSPASASTRALTIRSQSCTRSCFQILTTGDDDMFVISRRIHEMDPCKIAELSLCERRERSANRQVSTGRDAVYLP